MRHLIKLTFTAIGLMLVCATVVAEEEKKIYKYTDENGVTHYSETKLNEDYEEADLAPLSIVPSTPVKSRTSTSSTEASESVKDQAEVKEFKILAPVNKQNLWGTGGKLTAKAGPLNQAQLEVYQVQFIINGKQQKPADGGTQVFDEIYRGEHTVQAQLVNRYSKEVVKKSQTVTFFMHQNSKK